MHVPTDGPAVGVPPHVELQREVDSMQAVYTQQRRELEMLARSFECEVQILREQLQKARVEQSVAQEGGEAAKCWSGTARARQVRWRLGGTCDFAWEAPDPAHHARQEFQLPECPGVHFSLAFFPFGGVMIASSARGWRLALEVSGVMAEGLRLETQLSVTLEVSEICGEGSRSLGGSSETLQVAASGCEKGSCGSAGHHPSAEVHCEGAWPKECWAARQGVIARGGTAEKFAIEGGASSSSSPGAADDEADEEDGRGKGEVQKLTRPVTSAVVLCANLEVLSWEAPTLQLHSSWASVEAPTGEEVEEDDVSEEIPS